jgi:hypothetical protein
VNTAVPRTHGAAEIVARELVMVRFPALRPAAVEAAEFCIQLGAS